MSKDGKSRTGKDNNFFGKKHTDETKNILREKRKLQACPRQGKIHSIETKLKISATKKSRKLVGDKSAAWKGGFPDCADCGNTLTRRKAIYCLNCVNKGERAPNWKGGITPIMLQIRHCFKYRQWRSDIFTRDNYTCQFCGIRSGKGVGPVLLEADHYPVRFSEIFHSNEIKSLQERLDCEEFWNINNGRTLCRSCHNQTKKI